MCKGNLAARPGSAELKVLRILRLKKLQGEEIIGK